MKEDRRTAGTYGHNVNVGTTRRANLNAHTVARVESGSLSDIAQLHLTTSRLDASGKHQIRRGRQHRRTGGSQQRHKARSTTPIASATSQDTVLVSHGESPRAPLTRLRWRSTWSTPDAKPPVLCSARWFAPLAQLRADSQEPHRIGWASADSKIGNVIRLIVSRSARDMQLNCLIWLPKNRHPWRRLTCPQPVWDL